MKTSVKLKQLDATRRSVGLVVVVIAFAAAHLGACRMPKAPSSSESAASANANRIADAATNVNAAPLEPDPAVPYYETLYQVDMMVAKGKGRHPNHHVYTRASTPREWYAIADDLKRRNPGISGILITFYSERVKYDSDTAEYRYPDGRVEDEEQFEKQYGAIIKSNYVWDEEGERLLVFPYPDSLGSGKRIPRPK